MTTRPDALAALRDLRERVMPAGEPPPLRSLAVNGRQWTQLRLEQRLAAPRASAETVTLGPLHAEALLPRALALMQRQAPDYLQRLLTLTDALLLLEPLAPPPQGKPRAKRK